MRCFIEIEIDFTPNFLHGTLNIEIFVKLGTD